MAEQPIIVNPAETGKNIHDLIRYENTIPGVKFFGYPGAISQALVRLGMIPGLEGVDVPGGIDDFAKALHSPESVLLRQNIVGQQVPARWYEYIEDRKDIVSGVLGDYFLGPMLDTVGGFLAGYHSDNKKELDEFLDALETTYPVSYKEFYKNGVRKPEKRSEMLFYKLRKNEQNNQYEIDLESVMGVIGTDDKPYWPNHAIAHGLGPVYLTDTIHHIYSNRPD